MVGGGAPGSAGGWGRWQWTSAGKVGPKSKPPAAAIVVDAVTSLGQEQPNGRNYERNCKESRQARMRTKASPASGASSLPLPNRSRSLARLGRDGDQRLEICGRRHVPVAVVWPAAAGRSTNLLRQRSWYHLLMAVHQRLFGFMVCLRPLAVHALAHGRVLRPA